MRRIVAWTCLGFIAAGVLSATSRADDWTSPKEVAKSAKAFAGTAETLQKAIKDVVEDSPLVAEVKSLSKSAAKLGDSIDKGALHEDAKKDFGKIESGYAAFAGELKKAHDIHHEKPVADAAKKAKVAFEELQNQMTGKRPADKTNGARPQPSQEDNR